MDVESPKFDLFRLKWTAQTLLAGFTNIFININKVKMKGITWLLVGFVIFVHLMFFLLEAMLWMKPEVHNILIGLLDNPVSLPYDVQALTLKNLFVNQGFYNLFLVSAGIFGWVLVKRGNMSSGLVLLLLLCFSAMGAGIVLALTTKAYILALMQALPAAVTFFRLYPAFRRSLLSENQQARL